jgi:hypothetical protein
MVSPSTHRAVRHFRLLALLALAGVLLAGRPAAAQQFIVIAPDRSIVMVGPQQAIPFNNFFAVNPVVAAGNMSVRVGGNFSFGFVDPTTGFPGTGLVQPWTISDRVRASNFYGMPGYNPNPVITGPFRGWWR